VVGENLNTVAVQQIQALLRRLGSTAVPALFALDGGYDPVQLSVGLSGVASGVDVQIVVRIKNDRKFFTRPAPRRPGVGGRPRLHGDRFSCTDPATWPTPDVTLSCRDDTYGRVDVAAWHNLHPHQRTYREPGGAMTIVEATIIRVQVGRLPGRRHRRPKHYGCGGTDRHPTTWTSTGSGGPTCAASTSNTPSSSPSRPWAGPPRRSEPRSRPTGGPG
jgi:hypothetical protein